MRFVLHKFLTGVLRRSVVGLCLGGTFCSLEDKIFTHVVVEDGVQDLPPEAMDAPHVKIVKQEVLYASDNVKQLVIIQRNSSRANSLGYCVFFG